MASDPQDEDFKLESDGEDKCDFDAFIEEDDEHEDENVQSEGKKRRKSCAGRKLMRWTPEVDQLVLLCVHSVCTKHKIEIPWELIAKEVAPNLTAEGLKQHLVKMRTHREQSEQKVPERVIKGPRNRASSKFEEQTTTPTQGSSNKGKKAAENDKVTPRKPSTLLWHPPSKKKDLPPEDTPMKATSRKKKNDQKTPSKDTAGPGSGKKSTVKAGSASSGMKARTGSDNTPAKSGKRGRKKSQTESQLKNDEAVASGNESPTKKQKTFGLRGKAKVNYEELVESDEEEELCQDGDNFATPGSNFTKDETSSSQDEDNASAVYSQPPPPFAMTMGGLPHQHGIMGTYGGARYYHNPLSTNPSFDSGYGDSHGLPTTYGDPTTFYSSYSAHMPNAANHIVRYPNSFGAHGSFYAPLANLNDNLDDNHVRNPYTMHRGLADSQAELEQSQHDRINDSSHRATVYRDLLSINMPASETSPFSTSEDSNTPATGSTANMNALQGLWNVATLGANAATNAYPGSRGAPEHGANNATNGEVVGDIPIMNGTGMGSHTLSTEHGRRYIASHSPAYMANESHHASFAELNLNNHINQPLMMQGMDAQHNSNLGGHRHAEYHPGTMPTFNNLGSNLQRPHPVPSSHFTPNYNSRLYDYPVPSASHDGVQDHKSTDTHIDQFDPTAYDLPGHGDDSHVAGDYDACIQ